MIRLSTAAPDFEPAFQALLHQARETTEQVDDAVAAIIAAVRARGDAALCEFTARFDRMDVTPGQLRIAPEEIDAAVAAVPAALHEALDLAARRIEAFHTAQLPTDLKLTDAEGLTLGMRWTPLDAVGIYVPGGKAAYPSSVLMNAIPARAAGVGRIAMCVPTPGGVLNPLVLAAARRAGVTEIYRVGGAQAVAALAWGTASIAPVDRIVGPGNAYVAAAKRQVFGRVGIDSIAGPSEVVVVAGAANDPRRVAIDLLAQAEHDEAAQSILITDDAGFADAVAEAVTAEIPTLPRAAIAGASWDHHGAIILVRNWDEAASLTDRLAPEHLEVLTPDPAAFFAQVRHAGAAFLGPFCPEAVGDYVAGPNHVLPTGRTARFASGLSVFDFLKRTTWIAADQAALERVGPAAVALAEAEGLQAHGRSIAVRLGNGPAD
ncbi:Histidinol dehydrogenase [Rhodovastum atsumiense]|uniref:Histidinol dehydrogenase n=1 Tax=Rhodovastum atsumiense TaxID=504468 RepID=A0A5M6J2L3_9PROT|nr:histidinol dehydrogenase [Rhodovastum atsumiense]KAA5614761.1 histidinol dehydrogenase [Rhodovastum atsumiense]CAH2599689.1 Histidinol dehydrogenase [Rhodovastum atsumiense]